MTVVQHHTPRPYGTRAWRWWPVTRLGRLTLWVGVVFVVLLVATVVGVNAELVERGSLAARTLGVAMLTTGVTTLLAALVSLRLLADRSWALVTAVVVPALVVGAFALDLVLNAVQQ